MSITLPAEWAEQDAIQLTWPHEGTDWQYMLAEVTACYTAIAKAISQREKLIIVCKDEQEVRLQLKDALWDNITLCTIESNDTWARDHGGITTLENGKYVINDFCFNGWGLKFSADKDNQITRRLYAQKVFGAKTAYRNRLNFVLEGGSIESDGEGTLMTTKECLLSANRNEEFTQEQIENKLKEFFGLKRILWINSGYLKGDDTDSHVDTLVRFCDTKTIAYVQCTDPTDEHFPSLKQMEKEIKGFRQINGEPYHLIPLPMAQKVEENGDRLPATYANFLILNSAVLMPTYNTDKDEEAKIQLQKAFPHKEIIGLDCRALIKQHGSLHCITMQYSKGSL